MAVVKKITFWLALIPMLVFGGTAYYFYSKYSDLKPKKPGEETAAIIQAVGKLIVLPEDEQPTLATVSDPERLKDQPFFAHAKAGDKVLIYSIAQKAILYDPQDNKIVEVAPLNLSSAGKAKK